MWVWEFLIILFLLCRAVSKIRVLSIELCDDLKSKVKIGFHGYRSLTGLSALASFPVGNGMAAMVVEKWKATDVASWAVKNGLDDYKDIFISKFLLKILCICVK